MKDHSALNDTDFVEQFANITLPPDLFNHEAHLRLAYLYITNYGIEEAIDKICIQIPQFAAKHGANDKFNKTVTVAAIKAVKHFMEKSNTKDFQSFITENPRLINNFKDLLGCHYQTDIFTSEKARKEYLEPELLPFD